MNPLTKVAAIVAAIGIMCGTSYMLGTIHTADRWKVIVSDMERNQANALTKAEQDARDDERTKVLAMAGIDQSLLKAAQDEIISRDRVIADLRSNAISLRKRFTCPASTVSTAAAGTSTGQRDAAEASGLQPADAEFLVRLASDADQVAQQLQACQAVIQADRKR